MAKNIIPQENIERKIVFLRGQKVMLDRDLSALYNVSTTRLNEQVKRNRKRFPIDFMFQLTNKEVTNLKSQFATSSWGGVRKRSFAFTEQGVAMLSSVINSERAIIVNIQIMRTFTRLRQLLFSNDELKRKIELMERKYDKQFRVVFDAIKQLLEPSERPKKTFIGFKVHSGKN